MQIRKIISKSIILATLCSNAFAESSRNDCKELTDFLEENLDCKTNDKGEIIELTVHGTGFTEWSDDDSRYKKIFSYTTIKKLKFYDEYKNCEALQNGISNLKNLEELYIRSFRGHLVNNVLKDLKSLKKFSFTTGDFFGGLSKENIKELSTLSNLESLEFEYFYSNEKEVEPLRKLTKVTKLKLRGSPKGHVYIDGLVKVLKNLKELEVSGTKVDQSDVDSITSATQLEKLYIGLNNDNGFKCNIENFKNLKNLTYLKLNYMEDEIPEVLYSIPNLKTLIYNGEEIDLNRDNKISTNGKCGSKDGKCPSGQCCSKYGYCGTSDKHCYSGCQSAFGQCKSSSSITTITTTKTKTSSTKKSSTKTSSTKTSSLPTSTNGQCGGKYGVCPKGQCCSKYGYCGTSDKHCYSGCQSAFGQCKSSSSTKKTTTTTTTKKSSTKKSSTTKSSTKKTSTKSSTKKTSTKSSLPTSTNGKCGPNYGKCPSNRCCSKYGYCGTNDDYCGSGCQSEFGQCH